MLTIVDSEDKKKKLYEIPYSDIREIDPKYAGFIHIKRMAHKSIKIKVGKNKQDSQKAYDQILHAFQSKRPVVIVSFDTMIANKKEAAKKLAEALREKKKNESESNRQ
jgi:hypothetical protein